jgi:hypothetical protein
MLLIHPLSIGFLREWNVPVAAEGAFRSTAVKRT